VILTQGENGASAYLPNGTSAFVPTRKVVVKDTVGAGDTFFSAVLTYLHDHNTIADKSRISQMSQEDLLACLTFATNAAAINCMRNGANPPYRHEMDLFD